MYLVVVQSCPPDVIHVTKVPKPSLLMILFHFMCSCEQITNRRGLGIKLSI